MNSVFSKLDPQQEVPKAVETKILRRLNILRLFADGFKLFSLDFFKTYSSTMDMAQDSLSPDAQEPGKNPNNRNADGNIEG